MLSKRQECKVCVVSTAVRNSSLAKTGELVYDQRVWHLLRANVGHEFWEVARAPNSVTLVRWGPIKNLSTSPFHHWSEKLHLWKNLAFSVWWMTVLKDQISTSVSNSETSGWQVEKHYLVGCTREDKITVLNTDGTTKHLVNDIYLYIFYNLRTTSFQIRQGKIMLTCIENTMNNSKWLLVCKCTKILFLVKMQNRSAVCREKQGSIVFNLMTRNCYPLTLDIWPRDHGVP